MKSNNIEAAGYVIEMRSKRIGDFISLTDIAKYKTSENPGYVIQNWMRNRNTIRFLGLWESFHNPEFNYLEFEANRFTAYTSLSFCSIPGSVLTSSLLRVVICCTANS